MCIRDRRADVGEAERTDAPGEHREHLSVLRKVACEEQHDDDLGDPVSYTHLDVYKRQLM